MSRLLWLSHVLPHPPKGGVLQRSHHLLRGAATAHQVDLVTFRQRAFHPDLESVSASAEALSEFVEVRAVVDLPSDRSRAARARALATSVFTAAPYSVRWNCAREMEQRLGALARETRYDLVHFDSVGMLQYRHHFSDAAWVLNHHNVESHMMLRRARHAAWPLRPYLAWEGMRLRAFERRHGGEADLHLVVSPLDRERLARAIPDARAAVVENPVDTAFFRPGGTPRRAGRVVFVGRIDAYANLSAVRWLRDAIWPLLIRSRADATLAIVGRNPPQEVRDWAARDASVEVSGFVEDVRPWFDEAEVFVCPIFEGGGTRLKVLDAMAMGLPVVSHPMAIEGLDVVPGEHVLVADDAPGIARALERLLADAELREQLGRAARARVDGLYSTQAVHKHLREAYASCLEGAPRRRNR